MKLLHNFAKTVTVTNVWIGRFASFAVLILFALLFGDVIARYVQQRPIAWSGDVSSLLFGVYAIVGGGHLLAHGGHVNVDLFYARFSPKRRALVDAVTSSLFFLFIGVLLIESYEVAVHSVARWEVSYDTAFRAWVWPSKVMIFVSALMLFLQGLVKFAADILTLFDVEYSIDDFGPRPQEADQTENAYNTLVEN